jgi:hypothetical protein
VEGLEVEDYGAGGLDGALSYFGAYAYVSCPFSLHPGLGVQKCSCVE